MDKFTVKTIAATPNPQQVIWMAMHQDYSAHFVADEAPPEETKAGELVVKHLLSGDRGHFGPLEHPQITLNVGYFPHSTIQQLARHRLVSFDIQSFRYTSNSIIKVAQGRVDLEDSFYFRPVGEYRDRNGKKYEYTQEQRHTDRNKCLEACIYYQYKIRQGHSEEHARTCITFDVRQHLVMSLNVRSLMHILDIRGKADAQLEIQKLADLLLVEFKNWMPEVASWYEATRWKKGKLAP